MTLLINAIDVPPDSIVLLIDHAWEHEHYPVIRNLWPGLQFALLTFGIASQFHDGYLYPEPNPLTRKDF